MSIEIVHENEAEETVMTRFVEPLREALQKALDSTDEEERLELPSGVSIEILSRGNAERASISVSLVDTEDKDAEGNAREHDCVYLRRNPGQWRSSPTKLCIEDGRSYNSQKRNYGWPKVGALPSPKALARVVELCSDQAQSILSARRDTVDRVSRLKALRAWRPTVGTLVDLQPFAEAARAADEYNALLDPNLSIGFSGPPQRKSGDLDIGWFVTVVSEDGNSYVATLRWEALSAGHTVLLPVSRPYAWRYGRELNYGFSDPSDLDLIPELHEAFLAHHEALRAAERTNKRISRIFLSEASG